MRLSRLLLLILTMVIAIAWIGLSVGASFHYHDHGEIPHDCPWCSVANFQLVLTNFTLLNSIDSIAPASFIFTYCLNFASSDIMRVLAPRAPPIC